MMWWFPLDILTLICLCQVTLLTGVERYNEMTYIFDILMAQQQFELVLTARSKQVSRAA